MEEAKHFLTAEEILDKDDATYEEVFVEEWGGHVRVRTFSADEAIKFSKMAESSNSKLNVGMMTFIVATCTVNEENGPLFSKEQAAQLSKKNFRVFSMIQKVGLRLNGFGDDGELQDKTKNESGKTD